MTEEQARAQAERVRSAHAIPDGWTASRAERRIIQLGEAPREQPARVCDRPVWVVHFSDEMSWIELALDDVKAEVVRVEHSR